MIANMITSLAQFATNRDRENRGALRRISTLWEDARQTSETSRDVRRRRRTLLVPKDALLACVVPDAPQNSKHHAPHPVDASVVSKAPSLGSGPVSAVCFDAVCFSGTCGPSERAVATLTGCPPLRRCCVSNLRPCAVCPRRCPDGWMDAAWRCECGDDDARRRAALCPMDYDDPGLRRGSDNVVAVPACAR